MSKVQGPKSPAVQSPESDVQGRTYGLALALAICLAGCSPPTSSTSSPPPAPAKPPPVEKPAAAEALSYKVPAEWVSEKPASSMRKAQYRVPPKEGKSGDAALTLFYFGASGFSIESNVDRWREQMGDADANIEVIKGAACKTTLVDIAGTYAGDAKDPPIEGARLTRAEPPRTPPGLDSFFGEDS